MSSVGSFGVPLSLTETVPPFVVDVDGNVIVPLFGPSPPKESIPFPLLTKTSILLFTLSSAMPVTKSSSAKGRSFTGVTVISNVEFTSAPLPSVTT